MAPMPWRPWASRTVRTAAPTDRGTVDGLAYVLYVPDGDLLGGVVICHGAGSAKESHLDFARACHAHGMAAVAFDQRGHGETGGRLNGRAIDDVAAVASVLPAGPVALRGSSMGGWLALVATQAVDARAVVAICPAPGEGLSRGLGSGMPDLPVDLPAVQDLIAAHDTMTTATALGERLLLLHAEGDEVVDVAHSRALHEAAPGSRLVVVPGGHHRSVQHDPELQALALRFLAGRLRAGR